MMWNSVSTISPNSREVSFSTNSVEFSFPQLIHNFVLHKLCGIQISFPQIMLNSVFHNFYRFYESQFFHKFCGIQFSTINSEFCFTQILWNSDFHIFHRLLKFSFPQSMWNQVFHKLCGIQFSTFSTNTLEFSLFSGYFPETGFFR